MFYDFLASLMPIFHSIQVCDERIGVFRSREARITAAGPCHFDLHYSFVPSGFLWGRCKGLYKVVRLLVQVLADKVSYFGYERRL